MISAKDAKYKADFAVKKRYTKIYEEICRGIDSAALSGLYTYIMDDICQLTILQREELLKELSREKYSVKISVDGNLIIMWSEV